MPLPIAVVLLAVVLVTGWFRQSLVKNHSRMFFGGLMFIAFLSQGPEPALTYVRGAACGLSVALLITRLKAAGPQVLHRMRTELIVAVALTVVVGVAVLLPQGSAAQGPLLALIVILGFTFVLTALVGVGALLVRGFRQRTKSA